MRGVGRRLAVVGAAITACLAVPPVSPASAAPGDPQAAYWWQPEPVTGLIPVPGVPPNGLYIASAPSGPQAESAVRFRVANPSGEVRLTLHVTKQEQVKNPTILGYPATGAWSTGGPQPWSSRPSYRTRARPAVGVFHVVGGSVTTMTITFPAAAAAKGLVLLPGGSATGGQAPTFTVSFAPPKASDVSTVGGSSPSSSPSTLPPPSRSSRPGAGTSPGSSAPSSPPGVHTRPAHGTAPPVGSSSSAGTPQQTTPASASPPSADVPRDSDTGTRNVIIIAGVVAAALLILIGWRAVRRG